MTAVRKKVKRKHIRFEPEPQDMAWINETAALIMEEAYGGCGLLVISKKRLFPGQVHDVKVGKLDALKAEVAYVNNLAPNIYHVGFKYLE